MLEEDSNLDILIDIDEDKWLKWYSQEQWHILVHKIVVKVLESVNFTAKSEVSVLLTNDEEIHHLNKQYRNKDKPTNILSFPSLDENELKNSSYLGWSVMLGDIVLSIETILKEAEIENKTFLNHFYHLIVHGMLHLLGYDHEDEVDADHMQQKEINILQDLNITNPYQ